MTKNSWTSNYGGDIDSYIEEDDMSTIQQDVLAKRNEEVLAESNRVLKEIQQTLESLLLLVEQIKHRLT